MVLNLFRRSQADKDPLVRLLFKKYKLNLISVPRENASIGDLYMLEPNEKSLDSTPGNIASFLTPEFTMPDKISDETMADIQDKASDDVSANVGLQFLEGFLKVLTGSSSYGTDIRGKYESKNTQTINFQFISPSRDSVDSAKFGDALKGHEFDQQNALFLPERRYFVATGVARASGISISASDNKDRKVDVDVESKGLATGSASIEVSRSDQGQMSFKSANDSKKLAFGVELYELRYDENYKRIIMYGLKEGKAVRGDVLQQSLRDCPYFLGPNDSMFIDVE